MTRETFPNSPCLHAQSTGQRTLLAMLSGGLLSLAFVNPSYYWCTWVAFIPLLMALEGATLRRSYFLGLCSGLVLYLNTSYWMVDFIQLSKGYALFSSMLLAMLYYLYCAHLPALLCLTYKALERRRCAPTIVLFPLLVTLFFAFFPMVFKVRLGESQSLFISAIQATEFVGVHGLDTIIALANITLFKLVIYWYCRQKPSVISQSVLALGLIIIWFSYGLVSTAQWKTKITDWPTHRIGLLQPNEAPSLTPQPPHPGFGLSYPRDMQSSEQLAAAGAQLVIWPEGRYRGVFDEAPINSAFAERVSERNFSLLMQDIEHAESAETARKFNSALLITPQGQQGPYRKHQRIAFGEYIPLVSHLPPLKNALERFLGDFLNELGAGSEHAIFDAQGIRLIPLICYETMFPGFVAKAVNAAESAQQGALLVALSRNSWFGKSIQPYQHAYTSIIRAVENRIPLVHVVNNGPSIVALPSGEVSMITDYHQHGAYLVDVPYPKQTSGSFYSRYPLLYLYSLTAILGGLLLSSFRTATTSKN